MNVMATNATLEQIRSFFQNREQVFDTLAIKEMGVQFTEKEVAFNLLELNGNLAIPAIKELEQRLLANNHKLMWL